MALYETVFLTRPDIAAGQVEAIGNQFADIITKNGGKVTKREYWGLRNLAYVMNKNRKAHYMLFNIDAPAAAIRELDRNIRFHEDVMRHLIVNVEELEEGPSAVMQARPLREDAIGEDDIPDAIPPL